MLVTMMMMVMMMVLVMILLPVNGSLVIRSGTPQFRSIRKMIMVVKRVMLVMMMMMHDDFGHDDDYLVRVPPLPEPRLASR